MTAPYSHYKNCDGLWIECVPSHWDVQSARRVFEERRDPSLAGDVQLSATQKYGVVPQREFMEAADQKVVLALLGTSNFKHVRANDFVISLRSFQGGIEHSSYDGCVSPAYTVLRARSEVAPRYWAHALKCDSYVSALQSVTSGIREGRSISYDQFGGLQVPVPPVGEQAAIADFLDRETARIDALIAEQEKLLALLAEKRQATISHAVTRGLDPTVPLKESGVEWLGRVPHHWTVMPIRMAAKLESGHTPSRNHPEYWENCKVPWFTLADVWQIRHGEAEYVEETKELISELGLANSSARRLPKGTVLLSRTASVGFSAIMNVEMATTQDFANWVCGPKLLPEFLLFTFRAMSGEFERLMMGSTHSTIYMPDIRSLRFALPPLDEQERIVQHVRSTTSGFDSLIAEAQRAAVLLRERRSSLISAAVTGKIDVRDTLGRS